MKRRDNHRKNLNRRLQSMKDKIANERNQYDAVPLIEFFLLTPSMKIFTFYNN